MCAVPLSISFLQSPSLFPFRWLNPAPHTLSACNEKFPPRSLPPFSITFRLFRGKLKEKTGSPSLTAALSFHSLQQQTLCFSPSAPPPLWLLGKSHAATPRTRSPFGCLQNTISGKREKKEKEKKPQEASEMEGYGIIMHVE